MELNGVANIKLLIQAARLTDKIDIETFEKVENQLNILERYMLACADHASAYRTGLEAFQGKFDGPLFPYWHEVRDNLQNYPNNRERHNGLK